MNGLPNVSQEQIDQMNKIAKEKYGVDDSVEETPEQVVVPEETEEATNTETTEEVAEEVVQKPSAQSKDDNMRILRERSERAERERDELMRYLQEMQKNAHTPQTTKQIEKLQDNLDELQFNPDDLAEGKHLNKLSQQIKRLEEKLEQSEKKSYQTTTEMRIKRDYPDFEKVASYENLKQLKELDPDLAEAILSTPDPYKQHALAYKMVKNLGIYKEDTFKGDRDRAIKNTTKPRPLTSISPQQGDSPLSNANAFANGLTEDLKKQLYKEMLQSMKG